MTKRRFLPTFSQNLPQTPWLPLGHRFRDDEYPVVTKWGEILPPREFSRNQLRLLGEYAVKPPLDIPQDAIILARYLHRRVTFGELYGCWLLPLKADHDTAPDGSRRARYPTITIGALGLNKELAHRATARILGGQSLEGGRKTHVDHRCRDHACCSPFHVEAVTASTNNFRGVDARRHTDQPSLVQLPPDEALTYGQLAIIMGLLTDRPQEA